MRKCGDEEIRETVSASKRSLMEIASHGTAISYQEIASLNSAQDTVRFLQDRGFTVYDQQQSEKYVNVMFQAPVIAASNRLLLTDLPKPRFLCSADSYESSAPQSSQHQPPDTDPGTVYVISSGDDGDDIERPITVKVENTGASDIDCRVEEEASLHGQEVLDSGSMSQVEEAEDRPHTQTITPLEENPSSHESPEEDIHDEGSQLRTTRLSVWPLSGAAVLFSHCRSP